MKKYSYNFEDALKVREDRPTYCCFSVDYNGKTILEFFTNKNLEGQFCWNKHDCTYNQTAGTCQFSMPDKPDAIRRKLRKMADETLLIHGYEESFTD